jgi:hypothetical protein
MYDEIAAAGAAGVVTTGAVLAHTGVEMGWLVLGAAALSTAGALAIAGASRLKALKDQ